MVRAGLRACGPAGLRACGMSGSETRSAPQCHAPYHLRAMQHGCAGAKGLKALDVFVHHHGSGGFEFVA